MEQAENYYGTPQVFELMQFKYYKGQLHNYLNITIQRDLFKKF